MLVVYMESQCAVWDFRYNRDTFEDARTLRKLLQKIAKTYTFQEEKGDSGYVHWQGRLSLFKKRRKHAALKLFESTPPNYFEPTCNPEYLRGQAFYQQKPDTRISGPFTDKDPPPPILTQQQKIFNEIGLTPWMEELKDQVSTFHMRAIDLVYDEMGNNGKSLFSEHLEYIGIAEEIPPFRLMDDIFQWVASRPIKPVYIIDMPRGMKKDRLGDLYSGIEVIKNGVAYDKRYTAKKIRFDRPRIIVFTNELPCFDLMSADRWRVWKIKCNELYQY